MALSSEDKADVKGAFGKALANKVSKVTRDEHPSNVKYWARKDKEFGADKRKILSGDKAENKKVSDSLHSKLAKSKALQGKKGYTERTKGFWVKNGREKEESFVKAIKHREMLGDKL